MSVQYRSQFALACAEPDCARLECPPQPGGSGDFTVCAAFWPQHTDGSGLLIRQDDGLTLGYSGGNIYMEVPGVGRASSVPQDSHLIENEWNIAGAMYSGGAIQLYLNGRPVAANLVKKQETACRAGTAAPWDLGVFNGYLQRISFYDRGLSETEMCRTAFAPLPDVALDVDFNGYLPRTSGTQPNAVRLLGKCDTVNLVQALHPGRMGCALSIAGIPPVSDGFTLLVKCYLRREERGEREFLLSAGVQETPGFMGLALCDGRKTLSFFLAGGQLSAPVQLVLDRWVDLAVSVEKDGKAALYVDGAAVGSGTLPGAALPAALMLGNAQSAGGTLRDGLAGVMDSAALFSVALDAERLRSCAEDGLTVFTPSLEALWLFSEGDGTEQKHGGALAYSGGAAIEDCRNTVLDREPPELTPVLPEAAEKPDDMSRWEAGMVASVFNAVIQEVTGTTGHLGLPLSDSQVQAMEPVMQAISSQTISNIEKEQSLNGQDIKDMVYSIMAGGLVCSVAYGIYAATQNDGLRRVPFFRRFCKFFISPESSGLAWTSAAVAMAVTYFKDYPSPEPGSERLVARCSAALKSLAFYNEKSAQAGVLCMRPAPGKEPVLPEWSKNGQDAAVCCWAHDGETPPVLRAVFQVIVPPEYIGVLTFSAYAASGCDLLGSAITQSVTVSHSGAITIEFPLSGHRLGTSAAGAHQVEWHWFCQEAGQLRGLGTTTHRIHLLHGRPLSPWKTEPASANLPLAPLVELCSCIAGRSSTETDPHRRFLAQTVDWAYSPSGLQALNWEEAPRFTWWDPRHVRLSVDTARLCGSLPKEGRLPAAWQDAACLQLLLARLEGLDQVQLCFLESVSSGLLALRGGTGAGGGTLPHTWLNEYALCSRKGEDVPRLYDTFFRPKDVDAPVSGMELCGAGQLTARAVSGQTYWRDRACLPETYCTPGLYTQNLFIGQKPLKTICIFAEKLVHMTGRPDFDISVKETLQLSAQPARCHSISFDFIERTIIDLLNRAGHDFEDEVAIYGLKLLCAAVTVQQLEKYSNLLELCDAGLNCLTTLRERRNFGNNLARALNNVICNLRVGRSDWNASISSCFDPTQWIYIDEASDGNAYVVSSDAKLNIFEQLNIEKHFTAKGLPSCSGPGFYLMDPADSIRLSALLELSKAPYNIPPPSIRGGHTCMDMPEDSEETYLRTPLLYSSSNRWDLTDQIHRYEWGMYVYYVADNEWCLYPPEGFR